jgi:hypothetical protein
MLPALNAIRDFAASFFRRVVKAKRSDPRSLNVVVPGGLFAVGLIGVTPDLIQNLSVPVAYGAFYGASFGGIFGLTFAGVTGEIAYLLKSILRGALGGGAIAACVILAFRLL